MSVGESLRHRSRCCARREPLRPGGIARPSCAEILRSGRSPARSRRGEFRQELAARFPRRWRVPVHAIFAFAPSLSRFRNMRGSECIGDGGCYPYCCARCCRAQPQRRRTCTNASHPEARRLTRTRHARIPCAKRPGGKRPSTRTRLPNRRMRRRRSGSVTAAPPPSRPDVPARACEATAARAASAPRPGRPRAKRRKRTATARSSASASSAPTTCSAVWTSRCEGHADEVRTATAGASAAGAGRRPRPGDGCRRSHSSPSRAHTG